ncbi:MAG: alpha/beta hydrolase [Bradyrhizobium sp.]|nr:alpha/beta hydrolase [Bradyrhizobium sp.]
MKFRINADSVVSGLLLTPENTSACYVFAHGAGAGMEHRFMADVAAGLAARGVATLRYQFPYMEAGSKRPDRPEVAHAAVRAAVAEAALRFPATRLIAGGKSFGGRMTSQAQANAPMSGLWGLGFFGFPLHPAGKLSVTRAEHLNAISIPALFLQGTNDALADLSLIEPVVDSLGRTATIHLIKDADHSFHVPKRSGRTDEHVMNEILDVFVHWADALPSPTGARNEA